MLKIAKYKKQMLIKANVLKNYKNYKIIKINKSCTEKIKTSNNQS